MPIDIDPSFALFVNTNSEELAPDPKLALVDGPEALVDEPEALVVDPDPLDVDPEKLADESTEKGWDSPPLDFLLNL